MPDRSETSSAEPSAPLGAAVLEARGFSEISGQRVGVIASRASMVAGRSLIDLLAESEEVELVAIFTPEHGLRAEADAGVETADATDPVTGLPVFSLYGTIKRPTPEMLIGIDALLFDLQDVGARFYTYTATMGLAMQAASEAGIPFIVLDRPNPIGGDSIGGSVRDDRHVSFISRYPIPAIHGMTAGELALAARGEGWLPGLERLDLRVIPLPEWNRADTWDDTGLPWVPPSPGLRSSTTALVYPATVLFEGTSLSYGQGTDHPFEQIGAPWLDGEALADVLNAEGLPGVRFRAVTFTPITDPPGGPPVGNPRYEGQLVSGVRLEVTDDKAIEPAALGVHLMAAVMAQGSIADGSEEVIDRPQFFDLLNGTADTRLALLAGTPPEDIVESWADDLAAFERIRARYLLY